MSVQIADHKIALREYLRAQSSVTEVVAAGHIVLDFQDVTGPGNWVVLSRAGGSVDLATPMRIPRVDLVCYGANRWEAIRVITRVGEALGLNEPMAIPRIEGYGVVITDIQAEADVTESTDDRLPGVEASVPFAMQPLRLWVHNV